VNDLRFDGRVAIVTGAGRGIGREHAQLLGRLGASVVVNDVGAATSGMGNSAAPADEVAGLIRAAGGTAVANYDSVAAPEGPTALVACALDHFGRVDVLINNAGNAIPKPFMSLTDEDVDALLGVHFFGTLRSCRAVWPVMADAGYGRIVNTVSAAILGLPNWSAYGAAKGAILGLTLNLATEVSADIKVNALAPGAATRMLLDSADSVPEGAVERMTAMMPPRLVAPVAAFLSHERCPLNGAVLTASAGRVSQITFSQTEGWSSPELAIDDVAAHLERIVDLDEQTRWQLGG
jgi:NAD(P)-dependent dehydrogenase (short-subunit alcohol dehydrogenase family)